MYHFYHFYNSLLSVMGVILSLMWNHVKLHWLYSKVVNGTIWFALKPFIHHHESVLVRKGSQYYPVRWFKAYSITIIEINSSNSSIDSLLQSQCWFHSININEWTNQLFTLSCGCINFSCYFHYPITVDWTIIHQSIHNKSCVCFDE